MNRPLPTAPVEREVESLYLDIRQRVERARAQVAVQVNQALVVSYWHIGRAIRTQLLQGERAAYGAGVLKRLAERLQQDYGSGFSHSGLTRMAKFFDCLPDEQMVATLSQQLSWSHFVELIKVADPTKRAFYADLCAQSGWSVRVLRERMDSLLFERTAIAKQPDRLIRRELAELQHGDSSSPALFLKDSYLLDFLDLKDGFSEKDLEDAILAELERFILELGSDFAFMGRQRQIQVGGHDYYLDLLFFHRRLRRLVLIELKLGEFRPEHKGQVELYLKWLARHEQQPGENAPIAIILCSDKDAAVVELMDLEPDHIHVAEYWLQLPPQAVLQARLSKALSQARARLSHAVLDEDDPST